LVLLPLYVAVVALALKSRLRGMKLLALAVAGACLVRAAAALRHPDHETIELLAPMAGWLLLALAFALCPLPKSWTLERLEKLGGISYAIYVLHWPILSLMWLAFSRLGYRGALLFVLLPLAVLLLFALSWFSEHIYQPWWVRHYRRYLKVGH
jgi:peptidoglycan/LPS O-acetylase OafA/YrhL